MSTFLHTHKTMWLVTSLALFIGVWLVPLQGKYEPHRMIWIWSVPFTGESKNTLWAMLVLVLFSLFLALLSLLVGWLLQWKFRFAGHLFLSKNKEALSELKAKRSQQVPHQDDNNRNA